METTELSALLKRGEPLSGLDLRGQQLNGIDLSGGLLEHVDFSGASLMGASFRESLLFGCTFEGADLMNLGSRNVRGLDLWTWALGAHVPLAEHVTLSFAYERPFSHHKGIFKQRVTTSLALEF